MARRPAPLPAARTGDHYRSGPSRFPDLPEISGTHDVGTCPTCAPIVNSPAYARGAAAAEARNTRSTTS